MTIMTEISEGGYIVLVALLLVLIIAIVTLIVLLGLSLKRGKEKEKKEAEIFSKHISLNGLSDTLKVVPLNEDADIIQKLEEKEANEKLANEQQEILKLMTSNREKEQYKKALGSTIKAIRTGKTEEGN